ncbi:MAG: agmatinase [candidate division Zixibacteria bacterium]|nr:agmatinase [candidate division Zixibacteria bacterium]
MSSHDLDPPRGHNFLGLTNDESAYDAARVVIVPVAYDATTSYKSGTKDGPAAIIAASREIESTDRDAGPDSAELGLHTCDEVEAEVDGPAIMVAKVEREIGRHLDAKKYCVMLGGEHSLTAAAVRAHKSRYPDLSVLQIDAHADMRDTYQGSKHSHATVMRRVREICPAVSVGIRSASKVCLKEITDQNLPIFWARDCIGRSDWHDRAIDHLSNDVYLTFDLDGFDPSIMPSVGTPEPGGLLWYETIAFLKTVASQRRIVGFDVVELMPIPGIHHSDFTAARLVTELLRMTQSL